MIHPDTGNFFHSLRYCSNLQSKITIQPFLQSWCIRYIPVLILIQLVITFWTGGALADTAEEWIEKGTVLEELDRNMEAVAAYEKALGIDPDNSRALDHKKTAMMKLGRCEADGWTINDPTEQYSTLAAYDLITQLHPESPKSWYNKACVLSRLGRYEQAIEAINKAIEIDPEYANAWKKKGTILYKLGKKSESDAAYARAGSLSA